MFKFICVCVEAGVQLYLEAGVQLYLEAGVQLYLDNFFSFWILKQREHLCLGDAACETGWARNET